MSMVLSKKDDLLSIFVMAMATRRFHYVRNRLQPRDPEYSCPNGCFNCCSNMDKVKMFPFDFAITYLLHKNDIDRVLSKHDVNKNTKECPFLENGNCLVHAHKPLVCFQFTPYYDFEKEEKRCFYLSGKNENKKVAKLFFTYSIIYEAQMAALYRAIEFPIRADIGEDELLDKLTLDFIPAIQLGKKMITGLSSKLKRTLFINSKKIDIIINSNLDEIIRQSDSASIFMQKVNSEEATL